MLSPSFVTSDIKPVTPARRPSRMFLCDRFCKELSRISEVPAIQLREMLKGGDQAYSCPAGKTIATQGSVLRQPKILLSGWAAQQQISGSGRRKIFAFQIPGDLIGVERARQGLPADIVAITPCIILDASDLANAGFARFPQLKQTFDDIAFQHMVQLYQHISRLGSRTAYERLYSLLFELFHRAMAADLLHNGEIPFPLTQEVVADALGLSSVHVNRTLQQMRREGLLTLERGRLSMRGQANRASV